MVFYLLVTCRNRRYTETIGGKNILRIRENKAWHTDTEAIWIISTDTRAITSHKTCTSTPKSRLIDLYISLGDSSHRVFDPGSRGLDSGIAAGSWKEQDNVC